MDDDQRDATRLEVILLLIDRIHARLVKTDLAEFVRDHDDIDLLAYRLAMIGEEANKLTLGFKARFPHMRWNDMYRLRNIISHQYQRVAPERIWITATSDLTDLAILCRAELDRIGE
ncbi:MULTISPECIES: HepT-like ribonuclease domain-containing protein [Sphingobium]|jgi:uncharacterized protein with HEPN domain|uniref:HepT-like ribonuclease domain-containing protein n=1 Tax=Sphingobium TaxID=165695 RepID=UPI000DBAE0C0|nr:MULTISPECIES: HepT-like ribonuclease domain-containing protein [Sphingobium]KAA9019187.1 DUF86 domain-containing protein [Sphingobium limneticum]MBU0932932.1 DUF86 domain-containing protein [Alphaproteobacteria bacterium]BBD01982.1 hypothetical protein YGS_C1P3237 [Sphingobium sp. YG1]